jgi:hypothetical protein
LAAVADFLTTNDIGNAGATVVFTGTLDGVASTFLYFQRTANAANAGTAPDGYNLIQFQGTYTGFETTASNTNGYLLIS